MTTILIPEKIFKSYDIRGIYPDEINEENIVPIIQAVLSFFRKKLSKSSPTIVLGRDMRISSPSLFEVAKKILLENGAHVIDIGLVSTPTLYFSVFHYDFDGGIQISASHNPKEYNGIKIAMKGPKGLIKVGKTTGMEDIKLMALKGWKSGSNMHGSIEEKNGILEEEIKNALHITNNPVIDKYKIVADCANAMGALYIEALFNKIPGEIIKMNFELDGTFPAHQPDPLQTETLVDLQNRVIAEKADLGIAPDGDGDRLFFIDEKGQIVSPSMITSLVAKELLKENPGEKILFDIRYILTPQKIIEENGGRFEITKVGHAFITEKMNESGGIFAGESSAHYFFKDTGNAESQLPIILTILELMTKEKKSLSQLIEEIRRSHESGEINFKVKNAPTILTKLKKQYHDGELLELDGIAISYPDYRFSVRSSNTEPLLRLNVESTSKELMEKTRDNLVQFIQQNSL